jgi:hypothetical protein
MVEMISRTTLLQVGRPQVEIILLSQGTTTLMTRGVHRPILRHGVICPLLRAEVVVMRITTQATLEDKTMVDGTTTEVMDLEETTVGVETRVRHLERTLFCLQEAGAMVVLVLLGDRRAIAQAGKAMGCALCLHLISLLWKRFDEGAFTLALKVSIAFNKDCRHARSSGM